MPTLKDFGFCGPCYQAITPVLDAQDCLNYYPEPGYATSKSQMALIGTPGLTLFGTLPRGPVRALFGGNGRLFAVGGSHLYEVNSSGGIVTDFGAIGASTGTGPAKIAANGNDILVMDSSIAQIYCTSGSSLVFALQGFDIDYIDTFYVALNSAVTNQVNNSASLDGTTWPVLNFAIRTGTPDFLTACAIINNQLWLLGQKNAETWFNAGNAGFPFQRGSGASTINQGCTNRHTVQKIANTIQWLGADDRGAGPIVYQAAGQTPQRISTFAMEQLMATYGVIAEIAPTAGNVRSFAYQEDGHLFHVFNFNAANGGLGATLAYDVTTGFWHRRAYLNPSSGNLERVRADCFAAVPGFGPNTTIANLVGDYANGNIYFQSISTPADNGNPIKRIRTAPHVSDRDFYTHYAQLKIDCDIGTATCLLELSDDGGKTFRTTGPGTAIGTIPLPATGALPYLQWWQLGRSRDRVFRTTITSSTQLIRLVAAYLTGIPGTET